MFLFFSLVKWLNMLKKIVLRLSLFRIMEYKHMLSSCQHTPHVNIKTGEQEQL